MTLNPITVVDQVIGEYRSYLSTEFQARDPRLRERVRSAGGSPSSPAEEDVPPAVEDRDDG